MEMADVEVIAGRGGRDSLLGDKRKDHLTNMRGGLLKVLSGFSIKVGYPLKRKRKGGSVEKVSTIIRKGTRLPNCKALKKRTSFKDLSCQ